MCHAAGRGAYARAESVQRLHRQTKTVTSAAYHVFCGHATIIELYLAYWVRRDHLRSRAYGESRHTRADDEGGKLCAPVWLCTRSREDRVEIRDASVGDESLAPAYDVKLVLALSFKLRGGLN